MIDRREAWICRHKTKGVEDCKRRIFIANGDIQPPKCPEHGHTMERQKNKPYRGQKT
jgi:hypothetical protein